MSKLVAFTPVKLAALSVSYIAVSELFFKLKPSSKYEMAKLEILLLAFLPCLAAAWQCNNGMQIYNRQAKVRVSFGPLSKMSSRSSTILCMSSFVDPPSPEDPESSSNDADDIEFESSVDWDAEWSKVVRGDQDSVKRPSGRAKTDVEIVALRAKKTAADQVLKVKGEARNLKNQVKRQANWRSLQGDWKFWVGVLAIVSVATSLISASGQTISNNDPSFYI